MKIVKLFITMRLLELMLMMRLKEGAKNSIYNEIETATIRRRVHILLRINKIVA